MMTLNLRIFLSLFFSLLQVYFFSNGVYAQCSSPVVYTNTGNNSFFVPAGVTSITVEVWGGGGGGSRRSTTGAGGGGGGGAFSRSILSVSPGQVFTVFVGNGGASEQNGLDSWVSTTTDIADAVVLARGGLSPGLNNINGALGGRAIDGIFNDVGFDGGDGANGSNPPRRGGGGGGAAGPLGPGASGSGRFGGSNGNGGGDGGTAPNSGNAAGNPGISFGGGGSGAARANGNRLGGAGAQGAVIITYVCPPVVDGDLITDGATDGFTLIAFNNNGSWTPPPGLEEFEVLVVGGGGGGGRGNASGGGGAGQVIRSSFTNVNGGTGFLGTEIFNVEIGNGGTGSNNVNQRGNPGQLSRFDLGGVFEVIAEGGGGGGSNNAQRDGGAGASGGGGAGNTGGSGIGGVASNGNNGGNGANISIFAAGAGGGGAGSVGNDGSIPNFFGIFFFPIGGTGGTGSVAAGFPGTYAGGGGGNGTFIEGSGGSGVGGNANTSGPGGAGAINTGSGGGAGSTRGGNGSTGRVLVRYPNFRILPVEYLYFEASFRRKERLVELRWATGKEWENSHFEVERSLNNVKNWEKIGRMEGQGYSDGPVAYKFKDEKPPLVGGNLYYRLKQVDFGGTYSYSEVVSVQVPSMEITKGVWRAYPNPNSGENLRVELINSMEYDGEEVTVKIVTPTGFSKQLRGKDMLEISSDLGKVILTSPKGVYVLEIQWGRKLEYIKVLKQ